MKQRQGEDRCAVSAVKQRRGPTAVTAAIGQLVAMFHFLILTPSSRDRERSGSDRRDVATPCALFSVCNQLWLAPKVCSRLCGRLHADRVKASPRFGDTQLSETVSVIDTLLTGAKNPVLWEARFCRRCSVGLLAMIRLSQVQFDLGISVRMEPGN